MPLSGQARLIQNDLTAKGNKGGINEKLSKNLNDEGAKVKEIKCK